MNDLALNLEDEYSQDDQYLTFSIAQEDFGVKILSVQEIRGWEPVARVPGTPDYVKGVLNLRGTIVPIIDLRMRFELSEPLYVATTVVIILRTKVNDQERVAGIVVDAVSDVLNAHESKIRKTPDLGERVNTEMFAGLVESDGKTVTLVDVNLFLRHDDLLQMQEEAA